MQAVRIVDQFSALSDVDFASFSAGKVAKWDGAKLVGSDFVASLNTRTGAVTLTSGDVTGALTYTPVNRAGDQMSGLLSFGGITSSFPALKNSSAHLQVRLADDSGFGQLDTAAITVVAGNVVLDNAQSYRIKDNAGNIVSVINLTGGNNVQYNTSTVSGSLQFQVLNSSGTIPFLLNGTERVRITQGGLITLGGVTSSFPALKRSGAGLQVRLADDSGFSSLDVSTLSLTGAITFPAGVRQTFSPNTTTPGLNVGSFAGDPSTQSNGDFWYNSSTNKFRARQNGSTVDVIGGGGGATTALDNLASVSINTSLVSDTDNTDDLGSGAIKWKDGFFAGALIADTYKTSGPWLRASAANGNTVAIIAGDLTTYRSIVAASYKFGADDGGGADAMLSRIDTAVIGVHGVLEFGQVSSLGTVSGNSGRIGVLDVAGTGEVFAKDEAGNQVQLTAHAMDGPPWLYDEADPFPQVFKETNFYLGVVRWTNKSRQARLLERLLAGEDISALPIEARTCTYTETLPDELIEDWDQNQERLRIDREAQHSKWLERKKAHEELVEAYEAMPDGGTANSQKPIPFTEPEPQPHVHKEIPGWLAERIAKRDEISRVWPVPTQRADIQPH